MEVRSSEVRSSFYRIFFSVELGDEITDVDLVVSTSWYDSRLKGIKPRFGKGFKNRTKIL